MRKVALLLLLVGAAHPGWALEPVTVDQLQAVLTAAKGKPDAKVAQQLSGLELTERLSVAKVSQWQADLPGPESRRSLVMLADASAFLDPPTAEILDTAAPNLKAQHDLISLTFHYVAKTIREWPNFSAVRDTIRFEDTPEGRRPDLTPIPYQPLHVVKKLRETVVYRDGHELVNARADKDGKSDPAAQGLVTSGVFGVIQGTVLVDAAHNKLAWSHWEQTSGGRAAVFSYEVPKEKSHYEVGFCCVLGNNRALIFQHFFSAYHGVIAVDPANGAIRRLTLEADLEKADGMTRSDILVEYGPVDIGDRTYNCPLKSISILVAPGPPSPKVVGMERYRGEIMNENQQRTSEPLKTLLNDIVFENYHAFRADTRLLSEQTPEPKSDTAASEHEATRTADAPSSERQQLASADESPLPVAPEANIAAVATPPPVSPASEASSATPPAVDAEIAVAETSRLPEPITTPLPIQESVPTLRVTTKLVNLDVVALDKKGHPVTDLKPEDFEIYDNGRKQVVRFLSRTSGDQVMSSRSAPGQRSPEQATFSNRRADVVDEKSEAKTAADGVTILLIDAGNLDWSDLTFARQEMLKFLKTLSPNQRVGLYVLRILGFEVLEEPTADHALLASKLSQWMPNPLDLSRAQQAERRNRQQIDEVLHPTDLQYVNGQAGSAPETFYPVDPELLDNGDNPGRAALPTLAAVARHLAAIPGHKNLVWVSSDNVLVNWTDKAVSKDQGNKHIEDLVLLAQEALSDAHVSIYPLDASQLETMAVDSSLEHMDVQLAPGVISLPTGQTTPPSGPASGGRATAQMQQDLRPVQATIQALAASTGGRVFGRSGNLAANLHGVVEDGLGTYLLSFRPDVPPDDQYHKLSVKLATRRGVTLQYRTGYRYAIEPSTRKDRFRRAVWQPFDVDEIVIKASLGDNAKGTTLSLKLATRDLALKQEDGRWVDKLDIFLVQRENTGLRARVIGKTLNLRLTPETYQKVLDEGVPYDLLFEKKTDTVSIRIIVVDQKSGRMGSVTIPAAILHANL